MSEPRVSIPVVDDLGESSIDLTADVREVVVDETERIAKRLVAPADRETVEKALAVESDLLAVQKEQIRQRDADRAIQSRALQVVETALAVQKARVNVQEVRGWAIADKVARGEETKLVLPVNLVRHDEPVRRGRVVPRKTKPKKTEPSPLDRLRKMAGVAPPPEPTPASLSDLQRRAGV